MDVNIKCHSVHDDVEVYSDSSGLSLIKKDKNGSPVKFIFISELASDALLQEVFVPSSYLEMLFSISPSAKDKSSSYIVICNSGEVSLVLLEASSKKKSVKIGEIQGNVIWADIVCDCVLLLESCGKLHIGSIVDQVADVGPGEGGGIFKWKLILLSVEPICCCAIENYLVLSDGFSSYLYNFDNGAPKNKVQRLPYSGVISFRKVLSKIVLNVSDGRQYSLLLSTLKEDAQKFSEKCNSADTLFVENINFTSVMKSINRFSELATKEKTNLKNINLYLEQISFVHLFLLEPPKNLLSVKINNTYSASEEEYILYVSITTDPSQLTLKGDWWQLNVKLRGCGNVKCLYTEIVSDNNLDSLGSVKFKVPVIYVDQLVNNLSKETFLEFDLLFSDFFQNKSLCTFRVHSEPVDILTFLSSSCSTGFESIETTSFASKVNRIFKTFSSKEDKPIAPIHQKAFVIFRHKWMSILESLFPELSLRDGKSSETCTRWLRNDRIKLSLETESTNIFKLTVEGTVRKLISSVKICIEKRIFMHQTVNSDSRSSSSDNNETQSNFVKLKPDHYKELLSNKMVLNLEASAENTSEIALKRIMDSLNNLISSFPL